MDNEMVFQIVHMAFIIALVLSLIGLTMHKD
jgi:hypothetical protein